MGKKERKKRPELPTPKTNGASHVKGDIHARLEVARVVMGKAREALILSCPLALGVLIVPLRFAPEVISPFVCLLVIYFTTYYLLAQKEKPEQLPATLLYALQIFSLLIVWNQTQSLLGAGLLFGLIACSRVLPLLSVSRPCWVVIKALGILLFLSAEALMGVLARVPDLAERAPYMLFQVSVLGFIPGCFIAAEIIAENAQTFENAGWLRRKAMQNRKGKTVDRPRSLAQLFALFAVILPAMPAVVSPLTIFPGSFIWTAAPLFFSASLSQSFFMKTLDDLEVAERCKKLSAVGSLACLLAGFLA